MTADPVRRVWIFPKSLRTPRLWAATQKFPSHTVVPVITMYTCVADQPAYRWCVRAVAR